MKEEKTIVVDIKLNRGLVVALSCVLVVVVLLAYLTLTGESAVASETEAAQAASTGMRQFYRTFMTHNAVEAPTACAEGYHFASLWEISDPSNLKYNTTYGYVPIGGDSGLGPPSSPSTAGWVRTGYVANNSGEAGKTNCNAWSTTEGEGTRVFLPSDWTSGTNDLSVWGMNVASCNAYTGVWCIED